MHRQPFIVTTPRPTREEVVALLKLTPEVLQEVEESLKPLLAKWPPLKIGKKKPGPKRGVTG